MTKCGVNLPQGEVLSIDVNFLKIFLPEGATHRDMHMGEFEHLETFVWGNQNALRHPRGKSSHRGNYEHLETMQTSTSSRYLCLDNLNKMFYLCLDVLHHYCFILIMFLNKTQEFFFHMSDMEFSKCLLWLDLIHNALLSI